MPLCPKPSQGDLLKLSPRTSTSLTLGLLFAGLLAGCASTPASQPTLTPSVSVSREAAGFASGVNMTLVNASGENITFGLSDLAPGETTTAAGKSDVEDLLIVPKFSDGHSIRIRANDVTGLPEPAVYQDGCGKFLFGEGDAIHLSSQNHGFTVERLPDDNWNHFRITFTVSIADGARDICLPQVSTAAVK